MNEEVMSFEKAKKLSLKKWNNIKKRIINVACALGDDCGFCKRDHQLAPDCDQQCKKCEARSLCSNNIHPIEDALFEAEEQTTNLIKAIEKLETKQ